MSDGKSPSAPSSGSDWVERGALPGRPDGRAAPTRAIDSDRLFGGAAELLIDHHGVLYRLRRTALGKLILTK
jgi:hemin uptake protein HemP